MAGFPNSLSLSLRVREHLHRPLNPTLQTQNLFIYLFIYLIYVHACLYIYLYYLVFSIHLKSVFIHIFCERYLYAYPEIMSISGFFLNLTCCP